MHVALHEVMTIQRLRWESRYLKCWRIGSFPALLLHLCRPAFAAHAALQTCTRRERALYSVTTCFPLFCT